MHDCILEGVWTGMHSVSIKIISPGNVHVWSVSDTHRTTGKVLTWIGYRTVFAAPSLASPHVCILGCSQRTVIIQKSTSASASSRWIPLFVSLNVSWIWWKSTIAAIGHSLFVNWSEALIQWSAVKSGNGIQKLHLIFLHSYVQGATIAVTPPIQAVDQDSLNATIKYSIEFGASSKWFYIWQRSPNFESQSKTKTFFCMEHNFFFFFRCGEIFWHWSWQGGNNIGKWRFHSRQQVHAFGEGEFEFRLFCLFTIHVKTSVRRLEPQCWKQFRELKLTLFLPMESTWNSVAQRNQKNSTSLVSLLASFIWGV